MVYSARYFLMLTLALLNCCQPSVSFLSIQRCPRPSRRISATESQSIYNLDDYPSTDPDVLSKIVHSHVHSLDKYLQNKPIAAHTRAAFDQVLQEITTNHKSDINTLPKIVLDSGCGTGKSSILLGKLYPDCIVLGIDRSIVRLEKNKASISTLISHSSSIRTQDLSVDAVLLQTFVERKSDNVYLIRAELADFWRCILEHNDTHSKEERSDSFSIDIYCHYLLYPNPVPKRSRLKTRWYAHSAMPLLLQNIGQKLIVRSNWKTYMDEFAYSTNMIGDETNIRYRVNGPYKLVNLKTSMTNFEEKFIQAGEPVYELEIARDDEKD